MRISRIEVFRSAKLALILGAVLALSACDSAEERAERHFENAMALLAEGDEDRAVVEFRNVFKLNGSHRDARAAYAALRRDQGNFQEAMSQYLRLVEQYPSDRDGNIALAQMYAEVGGWEEMTRFLDTLSYAAEGEFVTRSLRNVQTYRLAVEARDLETADAAAAGARALLEEKPDDFQLHQVVIDALIRNGDMDGALSQLDTALEYHPDSRFLYASRLSVLAAQGDALAIEAQLLDNIERFPGDDSYSAALIQYYISQSLYDEAERFLRQRAADNPDQTEMELELVHFLLQIKGTDAALEELTRVIDAGTGNSVYLATRASIMFDAGMTDEAMTDIQARIRNLDQGEELDRLRVTLANMQILLGQEDAARKTVSQILVEDSSNIDALKLQAEFLIDDDKTGEAIATLRTALDEAPGDPEIYTTLALAHQRDGNADLVADMLALAVDASNQAAPESLRYIRLLLSQDRPGPAESIAIDALRRDPTNSELLYELGRVYLVMREWGRLDQVISTLRNLLQDDIATAYANELHAISLRAQSRTADAIEFLEGLVAEGGAGFDADVAIVRSYMENDNPEGARQYVIEQLAQREGDVGLRFLDATIDATTGNVAVAGAKYDALLADAPGEETIWMAAFRLYQQAGDDAKVREIVERGNVALPDSASMQWLKASILEQDGDIDGAISIYERMYEADSDNEIVANNLASLLVSRAQDPETVNRAFVIARRLRNAELPPYQDTYGWLAVLRGDFAEAIRSLEPASAGMPEDPVVRYHLARAYQGDNRNADALATYESVLEMVDAMDDREFVADTRARLEQLSQLPELNQ